MDIESEKESQRWKDVSYSRGKLDQNAAGSLRPNSQFSASFTKTIHTHTHTHIHSHTYTHIHTRAHGAHGDVYIVREPFHTIDVWTNWTVRNRNARREQRRQERRHQRDQHHEKETTNNNYMRKHHEPATNTTSVDDKIFCRQLLHEPPMITNLPLARPPTPLPHEHCPPPPWTPYRPR